MCSPGIYARSFMEGRHHRGAAHQLPPGGRRRRALVLPAPVADARVLAVPDGVDGLGPVDGDLPGPVPQVPGRTVGWPTPPIGTVWAFLGDGEMDEPESLGAISLAAREKLDNLIFVVNCNLQRLDGPVRGNGKIIQELEGVFRGAGWNVIKVIWGSGWDPLLAADTDGPAAAADGGVRRRRVPGLQVQERRLCPRALLRQVPGAAGPGRGHERRPDLGALTAAATTR